MQLRRDGRAHPRACLNLYSTVSTAVPLDKGQSMLGPADRPCLQHLQCIKSDDKLAQIQQRVTTQVRPNPARETTNHLQGRGCAYERFVRSLPPNGSGEDLLTYEKSTASSRTATVQHARAVKLEATHTRTRHTLRYLNAHAPTVNTSFVISHPQLMRKSSSPLFSCGCPCALVLPRPRPL